MQELTDFRHSFECNFFDFVVVFNKTVLEYFGKDAIQGVPQLSFFSFFKRRTRCQRLFVKTGSIETTECFVGQVAIKKLSCIFIVGETDLQNGHLLPNLHVLEVSDTDLEAVRAFLELLEKNIKTKSIYKGKAITPHRNFLNLSGDAFADVVFNESVMNDLHAHVFSMFVKTNLCIQGGIPLQRKILFSGSYGSGKTLAARKAAQIALAHGWTVLYITPTEFESAETLRSAYVSVRPYQPALIVIEDIDAEQRLTERGFTYRRILEVLSGFESLNDQVVTIMTSNHPKNIGPAMQRPGRIDKEIDFNRFDYKDAIRLLQKHIPEAWLDPHINWEIVGQGCLRYQPAFVREVAVHAKLRAISVTEDSGVPVVTQVILTEAAVDLQDRHRRCLQDVHIKLFSE